MRTTTFEESCAARGYDPENSLPDVSKVPEKHRAAVLSYAKMVINIEAINDGHEFDWNNDEEEKWIAVVDMEVDDNNPTGFRLDYCCYDRAASYTAGGSRLCCRTEADARFAFETFRDDYFNMMVIKK